MGTNTYSASDVILVFGGYPLVEWDQLTLKYDENFSNTIQGIRGKSTRVINKTRSATIEIVCPQTSLANEILRQIVVADQISNGACRLDLMLKDLCSGFVFETSEAYVVQPASSSYGEVMGSRTWTIQCTYSYLSAAQESGDFVSKSRNIINNFI